MPNVIEYLSVFECDAYYSAIHLTIRNDNYNYVQFNYCNITNCDSNNPIDDSPIIYFRGFISCVSYCTFYGCRSKSSILVLYYSEEGTITHHCNVGFCQTKTIGLMTFIYGVLSITDITFYNYSDSFIIYTSSIFKKIDRIYIDGEPKIICLTAQKIDNSIYRQYTNSYQIPFYATGGICFAAFNHTEFIKPTKMAKYYKQNHIKKLLLI